MTELEHLMVENMKTLLANQTRLAQQLNAISERLNEADATQNECAELLKRHGQYFESLLPRT